MAEQSSEVRTKLTETISLAALLLVVYFAAGILGLRLAWVNASVSPVWPPSGIALAALLLLGYRYAPVIWFGAFFVNYTIAGSVVTSACIASGNTLEAILAAYLVHRLAGGRQAMSSAASALKFAFLAVPPSAATAATVGALTLCLGRLAPWQAFKIIWLTWWMGDAVGAFILVPPLLYFLRPPQLAKVSLERKVTVALSIALASIFAIGMLQYRAARTVEQDSEWVAHTDDVIRELDAIDKRLSDADASVQRYVMTEDPKQLAFRDDATARISRHLQDLRYLTSDNPAQQQALVTLEPLMAGAIRSLQEEISYRNAAAGPSVSSPELVASVDKNLRTVHESIATIEADEFRLLSQRQQSVKKSNYQSNALIFAGFIVAMILVAISGTSLHFGVAAQRRAEENLHASRERFRMMVESVEDYAIFMLDAGGRVVNWNIGAERINGYKSDEIVGKSVAVFYPQDAVAAGEPQRALDIAARDGRWEGEGWRVRKDGSKFWVNAIIARVKNEHGDLLGFTKITRDTTQRNLARQALENEVTVRRAAQQELQKSETSLRQLSLHLLRAQDDERRRIGRDLHDSLGQTLSVLMMKLESLESAAKLKDAADVRKELRQCAELVEEGTKEVRTISYLLHPPMLEEIGLQAAMPWYLDGFSERSDIKTSIEISDDFGRVSGDVEMALFRVLQESLTNIHKHSGSPTADVRLFRENDSAVLEVADRGKGMPTGILQDFQQISTAAFGVGLRGMSERMRQLGGTLEIRSNGTGTVVRAIVPAEPSSIAAAGRN